jgi:hypothetical protein
MLVMRLTVTARTAMRQQASMLRVMLQQLVMMPTWTPPCAPAWTRMNCGSNWAGEHKRNPPLGAHTHTRLHVT